MLIKCPECQEIMREVKTSSNYGIPIVIEQCEKCGGLWFDDDELYRTKLGMAHEIESKLNVEKLRKISDFKEKNLFCPKDNTKLEVLEDKYFPMAAIIEFCPKCNGFWFNRGEFIEFQNSRRKKIIEREEEKIKKIEAQELDKELNKKVMGIMRLYHDLGEEKRKAKEKKNIETIFYIIWMLLRMLLIKK